MQVRTVSSSSHFSLSNLSNMHAIETESSVPTKRICDIQALTEPLSQSFFSGNFDMGPIVDPFFDDCAIQQTLNSIDWGAIFESQD